MKLILFDIDGTLLDSGGAGLRALESAFEKHFSVRSIVRSGLPTELAGRTDLQILRELCIKSGIPFDEASLRDYLETYVEHLGCEVLMGGGSLKPAVVETLEYLSARSDVALGLLTGNIEPGARIKLDAFGLNKYFGFGAFGNDAEERDRLLPFAVGRYERLTGRRVDYGNCVIIGDTPRDVSCAKVFGAVSLAVATGPFEVHELRASGADMAIPTLEAAGEFWAKLFRG